MREHLASLVEDMRRRNRETAVVEQRGNRHPRTSYGELGVLAGRVSAELHRRRIAPGDRVVLWGEASSAWMGAFFGCLLRGVLIVPLDAAGSVEFVLRVIADTTPKLVLADRPLLAKLTSIENRFPLEELSTLPAGPDFSVDPSVGPDTAFQIVFTSGTTAEPRGIVHTHRNVLASLTPIEKEIERYRRYEQLVHPLRFLHMLPLSHVFGQFMGLWIAPVLGAEVHFTTDLDPARTVETMRQDRINVLIAVPRILMLLRSWLLDSDEKLREDAERARSESLWRRWWTLRRVHRKLGWRFWALICGGATLSRELESFWNGLGLAVIQGYGMTETAALVTLNHPFRIGHGTLGKPLPGREVRLGKDGEILVRGEMVSSATWQHGAMQPRTEEWLATGDLASHDESGELRFQGRKGDVIVTASGLNIHPADLEAALLQQGFRAAAVVACETGNGQEPVAAVIFDGNDRELSAAVQRANATLADFQQIKRYVRWPDAVLPYTSTGKFLRRQIAAWTCAAIHGDENAAKPQEMLLRLIAEVTGEQLAQREDDARLIEDIHLDSLARVQLQSLLESRMSVEISDDAMAQVRTLGELRRMVGMPKVQSEAVTIGQEETVSPASDVSGRNAPSQKEATAIRTHAPHNGGRQSMSYPRWPWRWPVRIARGLFLELIARPLVLLLAAPRITRDTVISSGPMLLIGNHVTAYDGPLILAALPSSLRRRVAIAMAGELLLDMRHGRGQGSVLSNTFAPAGYWLITALFNVFPLPRLRGFRRSFAHAGRALDHGYSVMVFPEGHRSETGALQPFRQGIGLLAQESQVPVLPIALKGLGELRASRRWLRSGKLSIHVGTPVSLPSDATAAEWTQALESAIRELLSG